MKKAIGIRLDAELVNTIKREAIKRNIGYQTLINNVLVEVFEKPEKALMIPWDEILKLKNKGK
jgi:uncharacterized protein (DUF4415 family)